MEKRKGELSLPHCVPPAPEWLTGSALAEWDRILSESRYAKAITSADRGMLTTYCLMWQEIDSAVTSGKFSEIQTSRLALFATVCSKLGLTPPDRVKIHGVEEAKPQNKYAALAEESKIFAIKK